MQRLREDDLVATPRAEQCSLLPAGHSSILLRDAWRRLRRATMGARAVGCSLASDRAALTAAVLASATIIGMSWSAEARLVRINADKRALVDLPAFGATEPYLKISGTFDGELDPLDLHNAPIADIDLAPRWNDLLCSAAARPCQRQPPAFL
jgi:hypothetical protein